MALIIMSNGNVLLGASHSVGSTFSVATKQYVDSMIVVGSSGSSGSSGTSGVAGSSGSSGASGVSGVDGSSGTSGTSTNIVLGNPPPLSGVSMFNNKYTNNDTRTVLGEPDTWIQITIGDDVYNVPGYKNRAW